MRVSPVTFTSVKAVSGKKVQVNSLYDSLFKEVLKDKIIAIDVTEQYKYMPSSGMLAQAAQRGDKVQIYITGDDVQKVNAQEREWNSITSILTHMSAYFDLRKESKSKVLKEILK